MHTIDGGSIIIDTSNLGVTTSAGDEKLCEGLKYVVPRDDEIMVTPLFDHTMRDCSYPRLTWVSVFVDDLLGVRSTRELMSGYDPWNDGRMDTALSPHGYPSS